MVILAHKLNQISGQAQNRIRDHELERQNIARRRWMREQIRLATSIIDDLPAKLEHHAANPPQPNHYDGTGPRSYNVMTLDPAHGIDGVVENLKGAPAIIRDWCHSQGLKVKLYYDIDTGTDWSGYHMLIMW